MTRLWFAKELETVASYWRIFRRDGVVLGFTSHDRNLAFDDIVHLTAPGMIPSAIRRSADLDPDSAEVRGALSHRAIRAAEVAAGRFDGARIEMGLVDWESLESRSLYDGTMGAISQEGESFTAELQSLKIVLNHDPLPKTSPTCRAAFCGPGCTLSPARFTHEAIIAAIDFADNAVTLSTGPGPALLLDGHLRWVDGPQAGLSTAVAAIDGSRLVLDRLIDPDALPGSRVEAREGCDHRLETCAGRFGNAKNFRGEPFLPGNDLLTRYPVQAA